MKNLYKYIICLISTLCFVLNVYAASPSDSITAESSGKELEYISGIEIYYNESNYDLFILDEDTYFNRDIDLYDPEEVDEGFIYISNNSDFTSNDYINYYIAQVAILWYEDFLNDSDDNISKYMKEEIIDNNDSYSKYVVELLEGAIKYKRNISSINVIDEDISFSLNGDYYISNIINLKTINLKSNPSIKLYNAPENTEIINDNISKNGAGSFQIRIPANSIELDQLYNFEVHITGEGEKYSLYKYSDSGSDEVIYARIYTESFSIEKNIYINDFVVEENKELEKSYSIKIISDLKDSANIIKIKRYDDTLIDSFRSNIESFEVSLKPDLYVIIDTNNSMEIFFDVTENGEVLVHENSEKIKRDTIILENYLLRYTLGEDSDIVEEETDKEKETEKSYYYDEKGNLHITNFDNIESIEIKNEASANAEAKVEWLNSIIECPITSLSSTIKYIIGAIILSAGVYLVVRNVKKQKNNI